MRYQSKLSVVLCDIDFFKDVNDTRGHRVGDQVLVEFAKYIAEPIRSDVDWVARYGGDEFAIVLPETDVQSGCIIAERVRHKMLTEMILDEGKEIGVTGSFGVVGVVPTMVNEEVFPEDLLGMADKYLYKAKREGRNRVVGGLFSGGRSVSRRSRGSGVVG